MPGSAEEKAIMDKAYQQTKMAYVLADVAESFALDSMRNLALVGNKFRNEEKQKWSDLRRLVKLMDARLRSITDAGYETQHNGNYEENSDKIYNLMGLICESAREYPEILDQLSQYVAENFPPICDEKKEE